MVGGDSTTLTLTAIVRTDDTSLTITGEAVTDLANYASGTSVTSVSGVDATDQNNVPNGCKRKVFSVSRGTDERKFLRIKVVK